MTKRFEWDSALDKVYDYDKPCAGTFTSYHEWEIVDLLNDQHEEKEQLKQENKELKKQLRREETDKKRLMSYLMRYKGFGFDEIVEDFLDEPYYDNWWEDGFYECCWDEYLKEKGFDGCAEE